MAKSSNLEIDVGQTSVAKYMARHRRRPSQGWKTFVRNHADGIASIDLFVVPTLSFRLLYGLLILRHGRRQILWLGVTAHPTAEWIARQLTFLWGGTYNPIIPIMSSSLANDTCATFSSRRPGAQRRKPHDEGSVCPSKALRMESNKRPPSSGFSTIEIPAASARLRKFSLG